MSEAKKLLSAEDRRQQRRELLKFVCGKTIAALNFDDLAYLTADDPGDFDIIFTDGSVLELYSIEKGISWCEVSAEEAAEASGPAS